MDGDVLLRRAAGAVMLAAAVGFGAASAQDDGATAFPGCDAARCLGVAAEPDVLQTMAEAGAVSLDAFADAVSFSYRGEEPVRVRVIAARYDRGRLVRYGVSPLYEISETGNGLAIPGGAEAIAKAFTPVTERGVEISLLGGAANMLPVSAQAYVGSVPYTNLLGPPDSAPLAEETLGADVAEMARAGSAGVVAVLPDDMAQRAPEESQVYGLVVWLSLGG